MSRSGTAAFAGLLAIGMSVGLLFGLMLDKLALVLPIGVAVGVLLGLVAVRRGRPADDNTDEDLDEHPSE